MTLPKDDITRWKVNGLPRKGWTLIDVIDLDEILRTCDWCDMPIRYMHEIFHEATQVTNFVGCICAGHLTEDYLGAKLQEEKLKKFVRRKASWFCSPRWKTSEAGSIYRRDQEVVIFRDKFSPRWCVRAQGAYSPKKFDLLRDAQLEALKMVSAS